MRSRHFWSAIDRESANEVGNTHRTNSEHERTNGSQGPDEAPKKCWRSPDAAPGSLHHVRVAEVKRRLSPSGREPHLPIMLSSETAERAQQGISIQLNHALLLPARSPRLRPRRRRRSGVLLRL